MKKFFKKIGDWWWLNIGYYTYMHKLKKNQKKNSISSVFIEID